MLYQGLYHAHIDLFKPNVGLYDTHKDFIKLNAGYKWVTYMLNIF